ncbi:MAG: xylulokinase [Alphaproteobacteria bacterium]|nr:xylulokinase [Alphaproteobacteria bacterium]MDE2110167.1 xylulokinase [Alphaproteobacteria bacterium]MDE2492501.1 xylulokinase [Alphaproteobacteria bacterium]
MYLGIDVGTSSVKAVLTDGEDRLMGQSSALLSVERPQPLWSEQYPDSWWRATVEAVRSLPEKDRRAIKGIGLSGQMHGATLLDGADRPLRPAILWNDGRSEAECAELEKLEPRSREITGNLAMPGFTAPKLLWVKNHEPEVFRRTESVLLPKDYVRLKLTGEKASDMSDAAGTLWLDVGKRDWSDAMLKATDLKRSNMPRLFEGNAPTGKLRAETADELGIPRVVVAGGGGDNAASAAGLGVVMPGQAFLSLGTSGVLFVVTDKFRPNPAKAAHAFCHCLPGRWHQMSVILTAAAALDWVTQLTGSRHVVDTVAGAEARGLRAGSPIYLPYLSGERTPHNDPCARGVFFGLTAETTGADLAHAVLEGVALAFADGLDALLESGGTIGDISVTGGGARLPYWGRILASALNLPLTYREGGEVGAAFGAARLGRLAATGEDSDKVCIAPKVTRVVQPEAGLREQMALRRPLFARLYQNLKGSFREFAR